MSKDLGKITSIVSVHFPTATETTAGKGGDITGSNAYATGLRSKTDGTVKVKLVGMDAPVVIDVVAGVKELYLIDTIYDDGTGSVPIADIMLFWQFYY